MELKHLNKILKNKFPDSVYTIPEKEGDHIFIISEDYRIIDTFLSDILNDEQMSTIHVSSLVMHPFVRNLYKINPLKTLYNP
jgi:hypothetical protein